MQSIDNSIVLKSSLGVLLNLLTMLGYAHEQKAHGGAVNRHHQNLQQSWALPTDLKHNVAGVSTIS